MNAYEQLYKTIYDGMAADPQGAAMTAEQRSALAAQEAGKAVRSGYGQVGAMFFGQDGKPTSSGEQLKSAFSAYRDALATLDQRKTAGEFDDEHAYNQEYERITAAFHKSRDAVMKNKEKK